MTSLAYDQHWTEQRLEPLQLTDAEVLDWLGEHCDQAVWVKATDENTGGFVIYCDEVSERPMKGATLREAVQLAADRLNEINK